MNDAGFGPVKDRPGVYARKDRRVVDAQHLNFT
jgi:hypothetical protein